MALLLLAGCRTSQQALTARALTVRYSLVVLPDNDAVRLIDSVRRGTVTVATLLSGGRVGPFRQLCSLVVGFTGPVNLSTNAGAHGGDRNFVVRVIADRPPPNLFRNNPASCGTVGDIWFYIGGTAVAPDPALQIGVPTHDVAGRFLLTGVSAVIGPVGTTIPTLDFSSPESGIAVVRTFTPGHPTFATGVYNFIDSTPLTGGNTMVVAASAEFNLSQE